MTKLYLVLFGTALLFSGGILALAGWSNIGACALIVGALLIVARPVLLALGAWWYPTAEQGVMIIKKGK